MKTLLEVILSYGTIKPGTGCVFWLCANNLFKSVQKLQKQLEKADLSCSSNNLSIPKQQTTTPVDALTCYMLTSQLLGLVDNNQK